MPKQTYSAPSKYNIPQYGAKQQLTQLDTSAPMSKAQQRSSAAEAEVGALYINAKHAVPLRSTLHELGHIQPPTPWYSQLYMQAATLETTILGVLSSCCDVVKHFRITAVGAVMVWSVIPSMYVAVILISVRFGSSAVIITSESLVKLGICS